MKSKDSARRSSRSNDLGRRDFLRLGAAVTASMLASPVIASATSPHERILRFQNTHTGEAASTVYWADGDYVNDGLATIDSVLRDHRTDEIYSMDTQLLDLLFLLQSRTDSGKAYEVISGYRSPATNKALRSKSSGVAKRSYHMRGMAIDVRLPGYDLKQLQLAARSLKAGGVGYYPGSGFIHVDVGPARSW
ncbi:MAG: DUF882 domain-containing protein [Gammaproteobacteria bacterium]|nr:DUF882 domain-containing protein [Gammaproteobacteria bacterium]